MIFIVWFTSHIWFADYHTWAEFTQYTPSNSGYDFPRNPIIKIQMFRNNRTKKNSHEIDICKD